MRFAVATERVEGLATELDALAAAFDDVAHRRVAYEGYADAHAAEAGLREFFGHWTDGMARLHGQLAVLARHLHDAAATYEAGEQRIVDAARPTGPTA